ncbi:hypothetical protein GUJ93_ZPchr0009g807 [Zizania palustris]|uniref:Uncharacterized protein n=1 Tax=Zizania palustris TaxID=103762 RepID=A0A8J5S4L1_ZIZPA|nr:hypothetical protein GUJ93_ZPchr0009g807 [Zizania palustris]
MPLGVCRYTCWASRDQHSKQREKGQLLLLKPYNDLVSGRKRGGWSPYINMSTCLAVYSFNFEVFRVNREDGEFDTIKNKFCCQPHDIKRRNSQEKGAVATSPEPQRPMAFLNQKQKRQ